MNVLVTGGAGYIGCHTVRALRERGHQVVVVDTLETGHEQALLGAPLVVGDAGDRALVRRVVDEHGITSVIHFAGYKNAGESVRVPERYFENNVVTTARLLDTILAAGVRTIVFSGSCSVYGTPLELPVNEEAALAPESPYAQSKLMGEQMLRWHGGAHDLRWMSLRYFNAAGASHDGRLGEHPSISLNLVPIVMEATLGRRPPVQVFGSDFPTPDGTAVRDYIHVVDLADAHVRALEHLETSGGSAAVNLGTGVGTSVRQVIERTERITGRSVPTQHVGRRPGDPAAVWSDNRLATELLDWRPQHDLDDVLRSAWAWHEANEHGYCDR